MKLMSWNCQGLGRTSAVHGLCVLVKISSLFSFFFIETKANLSRMNKVAKSLRFDNMHIAEGSNSRVGLALFWKDECNWNIVFSSS